MAVEPEAHVDSTQILLPHLSKNIAKLRGVRVRWRLDDISGMLTTLHQLAQAAAAQGVLKPEAIQTSQHTPTIRTDFWNDEHEDVVCAAFNGLGVTDFVIHTAKHSDDYFNFTETLARLVPGIFDPSEYADAGTGNAMRVVALLRRAVQVLETFEPPPESAARYARDVRGAQAIATMIRNNMDVQLRQDPRSLTAD